MLNIGPQELLLVLIVALIVVGPTRLPELSRQIGKGLREFRKVQDEVKGIAKFDVDEPAAPKGRGRPGPSAPPVHRTPRPAPSASTPETSTQDATPPATPEPGPPPTDG